MQCRKKKFPEGFLDKQVCVCGILESPEFSTVCVYTFPLLSRCYRFLKPKVWQLYTWPGCWKTNLDRSYNHSRCQKAAVARFPKALFQLENTITINLGLRAPPFIVSTTNEGKPTKTTELASLLHRFSAESDTFPLLLKLRANCLFHPNTDLLFKIQNLSKVNQLGRKSVS